MINFLLVKDKEIPVYLKYWYYKTKIEGLVFNKIYEATKVGTSLVLDNTIAHTMKINLLSSDTTQGENPSPDYPQEIHVVKGDNTISISNVDDTIEQSYTITLGDIELCKLGDYQDLIFKNTSDSEYYDSNLQENKWYKLGKIGKVILDGAQYWLRWGEQSTGNTSIFGTTLIDDLIGKSYYAISNYFINKRSSIWSTDEQAMTVVKQTYGLRIRINNTIASTVEEFQDWLSTHNTIVYYVLKTPTKTLLSDTLQTELDDMEENATTYNEETNITQVNDDRPFILDVSYFRKVKYNE